MMAETDDTFTGKHICHACIGEEYLSAEIKSSGEVCACAYCGKVAPCVSIEKIAEQIETAFDEHYTRTAWEGRLLADGDGECNYGWERDGDSVIDAIKMAAIIDEEPATDVLDILQDRHAVFGPDYIDEESEFDSDSYYIKKNPDGQFWREKWNSFEHSLKTNARFFSQTAEKLLIQVFGDIDKLKTRNGCPLVVKAGPGTTFDHLYRARVFQAEDQLEEPICRPDQHLSSPPSSAARGGRMNAHGISVFYGAMNDQVAIAEIRPPVGSWVVVAKFVIIRPLNLLDLTALEDVHEKGSIFDPSFKERLERATFLQTLGQRMACPVMPDDEALAYLPTQAVADFLATMNKPRFDGIIFMSTQAKEGRNITLFHHAARVEPMVLPEDIKIAASLGDWTEDGWEVEYSVREQVPSVRPETVPADSDDNFHDDLRQSALQIDVESVTVHQVNWVKIDTRPHAVKRYRSEECKLPC